MKVSFLLGAGFSKPAGFPLASEVSSILLRLQANGIATHTSGDAWLWEDFLKHLQTTPDTSFPYLENGLISERTGAEALEAVVKAYVRTHGLEWPNYENLYDELVNQQRNVEARQQPIFREEYELCGLHNDPERTSDCRSLTQALSMADKIFNQLVNQLIKRDPAKSSPGAGAAYQKLCNLLRRYTRRPHPIFDDPIPQNEFLFHTLNHDLFLEQLLEADGYYSPLEYSDGFEEAGSPYFGRLDFSSSSPSPYNKRPYHANVRMPRYTGEYAEPIQLIKLHGSFDYYSFGVESSDTGRYEPAVVKKQPWIPHLNLLREVDINGILQYRNDFTNYHPLFLTGTTAKLEYYHDPILFSRLLERFSCNLVNSNVLVIIGYGFRDEGINKRILPFLQDANKRVIIIGRDFPEHFPAVKPEMFREGGLEACDFSELEKLLEREE